MIKHTFKVGDRIRLKNWPNNVEYVVRGLDSRFDAVFLSLDGVEIPFAHYSDNFELVPEQNIPVEETQKPKKKEKVFWAIVNKQTGNIEMVCPSRQMARNWRMEDETIEKAKVTLL